MTRREKRASLIMAGVFVVVGVVTLATTGASEVNRHGTPRWVSGGALVVIGLLIAGFAARRSKG
jgi:cytochrome c biogenesis protein CcdA